MQDNHTPPSESCDKKKVVSEAEGNASDHVSEFPDIHAVDTKADSSGVRIATSDGRNGVWHIVQSGSGVSGVEEDEIESEHGSQHTGNGPLGSRESSPPLPPTEPVSYASSVVGGDEIESEDKGLSTGKVVEKPMVDMDGCIATLRAFVRGDEPGIRCLRKVINKVFAEYGVTDLSEQAEAIREMKLVPIEAKMSMSFLLTDGEISPVWIKRFHARDSEYNAEPKRSKGATTIQVEEV